MQLDRDQIADESMAQPVDLHRLYTEIVESFADEANGTQDVHLDRSISITSRETDTVRQRVREIGYEGLIQNKWIDVIGMDRVEHPGFVDALDPFELLIQEFGSTLSLQDSVKVSALFKRWSELSTLIDPNVLPYLLAETAVNQTLDRHHIGRIEMHAVDESTLGFDLAHENTAIVEMVRERIELLLR